VISQRPGMPRTSIDPSAFQMRLQNAGFEESFVEANPRRFRFRACMPGEKQ